MAGAEEWRFALQRVEAWAEKVVRKRSQLETGVRDQPLLIHRLAGSYTIR